MYEANARQYGFFVQRNSWSTILGKIIFIERVKNGQPIPGEPPYFGNANVRAELYQAKKIEVCNKTTFLQTSDLSCPETYAYTRI